MIKLPVWFSDYLDLFGIDKKNSAVVTRNWANVSRMRPADSGQIRKYQYKLAMAIYLWKIGYRQATGDALKFFGLFVSEKFFPGKSANSREYYRPESMDSALIWRLFLAAALSECCQDELLSNLEQTCRTWAQAIRDRLHKHLEKSASTFGAVLCDCDFPSLVAKNKSGESSPIFSTPSCNQVLEELPFNSFAQTPLRITTIHNVKGETLDALMLVSSRSKSGTEDGHWTQWFDDPTSEAARLAYVASSRPKKLIIWAIPRPSGMETDQLDRLKKIGFHVLDLNPIIPRPQTRLEYFFKKVN